MTEQLQCVGPVFIEAQPITVGIKDQIQSIPELQDYASSHFELRWKIVSDGYKMFLETDKLSWPNDPIQSPAFDLTDEISNMTEEDIRNCQFLMTEESFRDIQVVVTTNTDHPR